MKMLKFFYLLILYFVSNQIAAQDILTINEKDRDGKYLGKEDNFKNNIIVDINSLLDIQLNRANLNSRVGEIHKERLPEQLSKKISALLLGLEKRNEVLTKLNDIVNSYDYEKFKTDSISHKNYAQELQKMVQQTYEIEMIDSRITKEADKYNDPDEIFSSVYEAATKVLAELENEFDQFAKEEGIHVQFGCWLITKEQNIPIHLDGFDEIAPQNPYEVERWQFIPTDQQVNELKEIQRLAKDNKDKGLNILSVTAQIQLEAFKEFGKLQLRQLSLNLESQVTQVKDKLGIDLDPKLKLTIESIESLQLTISDFINNIDQRLDYYRNISYVNEFDLVSFFEHAQSDIKFITADDGKILLNKIKTISTQLSDHSSELLKQTDNIKDLIDTIYNDYLSKFNSFNSFIDKKANEFLLGRELDSAALKFGSEVYKLSLTDLPSFTELNLINTGVRTDGDRLVLKIAVSDKNSLQPEILETREIYMFKVLPHIITTVGVIFADPLANNAVQTQFQMAPAYNVIFKGIGDQGRRRKSVIYNRLFDWGVGLHISAPDFDKDDVPEIAAGVVISSLHDYLQGGFAFNLFTGDPFWFFGLRFPIPSFNMSASNPGTIE